MKTEEQIRKLLAAQQLTALYSKAIGDEQMWSVARYTEAALLWILDEPVDTSSPAIQRFYLGADAAAASDGIESTLTRLKTKMEDLTREAENFKSN